MIANLLGLHACPLGGLAQFGGLAQQTSTKHTLAHSKVRLQWSKVYFPPVGGFKGLPSCGSPSTNPWERSPCSSFTSKNLLGPCKLCETEETFLEQGKNLSYLTKLCHFAPPPFRGEKGEENGSGKASV